jgi:trans-aconitate methyltransferase
MENMMEQKKQHDNWNAENYKKHSHEQYRKGISILQKINLHGNEHILDVGCGDGKITAEFAKQIPQGSILGIDISHNMIAEAKKNFSEIPNLTFQCVNAALFLSGKNFDITISNSAFHWIEDQIGALKSIYNHLKPGGTLIIKMNTLRKGPVAYVQESQKWAALLSEKGQVHVSHTVETFSNMLNQCGFNNIDVQCNVVAQTFSNKENLFNWAFAWVPQLTGLPDDKAREFTQDIVDVVSQARNDGQLILESALLDITAIK